MWTNPEAEAFSPKPALGFVAPTAEANIKRVAPELLPALSVFSASSARPGLTEEFWAHTQPPLTWSTAGTAALSPDTVGANDSVMPFASLKLVCAPMCERKSCLQPAPSQAYAVSAAIALSISKP